MQRKPPKEEWMRFSICWPPIHCPFSNIRDNKRRGMSAIYIPTLAVFHLSKTQLLYIHSWDEWMDTEEANFNKYLSTYMQKYKKQIRFTINVKINPHRPNWAWMDPFPIIKIITNGGGEHFLCTQCILTILFRFDWWWTHHWANDGQYLEDNSCVDTK